jgi:hypothetical protein
MNSQSRGALSWAPGRSSYAGVCEVSTERVLGSRQDSADVGAIEVGGPGPFRAGLAPVAEAKIVFESLVAEVRLISDEKHEHRPAKDALQVAVNEFHGLKSSVSLLWGTVKSNSL